MKKHFIKLLNFIRLNFEKIKDFLEKKENTSLKDIVNDHIDNEREFSIEEKEMLTNIKITSNSANNIKEIVSE